MSMSGSQGAVTESICCCSDRCLVVQGGPHTCPAVGGKLERGCGESSCSWGSEAV